MKNQNFNLRSILLWVLSCVSFGIQAQKVAWPHFQNGNYLSTKFTSGSISWGNSAPRLINPRTKTFFTEYVGLNQQHDINGNVLFTVIATIGEVYLFDRNNNCVNSGNPIKGVYPEITIVPLKNGLIYHILVGGEIWQYNYVNNEFIDPIANANYGTYNLQANGNSYKSNMQAVRTINNNSCEQSYLIYSLSANNPGITNREIWVTKVDAQTGFSTDTILQKYNINGYTGIPTAFEYEHREMELSPDGSKLALVDNTRIFVYSINPTSGKITGVAHDYDYSTSGTSKSIAGIEFFDNNNIYYSLFDQCNPSNSDRGIYHWNIGASTTPVKLNASANFSLSMIEKGKNGKLYTVKSDGLYEIVTGTNQISLALASPSPLIPRVDINYTIFQKDGGTCSVNNPKYYLPDQLDNQTQENLDLDEVVESYKFRGPFKTYSWSNASHGFTKKGRGRVIVLKEISVPSSCNVHLDGMDIEFWTDAEFSIESASNLILKGTECRGTECGLMWKGITLVNSTGAANTNSLIMGKNAAGRKSKIADAYVGIKAFSNCRVETVEGSTFEKNERHMSLVSAIPARVKIWDCLFIGDLPLKNPNKGSSNGYSGGGGRTITAIELVNATVNIGDLANAGSKSTLVGGQFGIHATGSIVNLYYAEVSGQKNYGLWFDANKTTGRTLRAESSIFRDLYRGIHVRNNAANTEIFRNTFNNTYGYAIEYMSNPGGKLFVGASNLGNAFNNCNWAAIQCFDNTKYIGSKQNQLAFNSDILIQNNTINNHVYASGIAIAEPAPAVRSYGTLSIENNQIGTRRPIGQGIVFKQVSGGNPDRPLNKAVKNSSPAFYNSDFLVKSNKIVFTNSFNAFYRGIWTENSRGQNFLNNNISSPGSGDWRPSAMRISDGKNNLVADDTMHSGNGLQVTGDGMFSNYYCNTLDNCVIGIQLSWNFLRNKVRPPFLSHNDSRIHAHQYNTSTDIYGRPNNYNNGVSWGADIHVYTNAVDRNQWDFINGKIPKISHLVKPPNFSRGIVHELFRKNICNTEVGGGQGTGETEVRTIDYEDETNPVLQWKLMYGIAHDVAAGISQQPIPQPGITALVNIERAIQEGNYPQAASLISNYTPCNAIENSFKTVYNIWVAHKLSARLEARGTNKIRIDTLWLDSTNIQIDTVWCDTLYHVWYTPELNDSLVNILSGIAAQDATLVNPAAYPARAILWALRQLQFEDAPILYPPAISGLIHPDCQFSDIYQVKLFTANDNYTGISALTDSAGSFYFDGHRLQTLDTLDRYYLQTTLPGGGVLKSMTGTLKELAYNSGHTLRCNNPAPRSSGFLTVNGESTMLFPNPGNGSFQIVNLPEKWYLAVYNTAGQLLYSQQGQGKTYRPDRILGSGVYTVRIKNLEDGQTFIFKYIAL